MQLTKLIFLFALLILMGCKKDEATINPYNGKTSAVFNPSLLYGTITDIDGNIYKTIEIGTQIWMAENLRTTRYNDGAEIPNIKDNEEWIASLIGAYCSYKNTTNIDSISTFGLLYNWEAINTDKLAPTGWHVATKSDWVTLTSNLGPNWDENGFRIEGGKLKETGFKHWLEPNIYANNSTGFTALPAGSRYRWDDQFSDLGEDAAWWGYLNDDDGYAWVIYLAHDYGGVSYDGANLENGVRGHSIRCVKDN